MVIHVQLALCSRPGFLHHWAGSVVYRQQGDTRTLATQLGAQIAVGHVHLSPGQIIAIKRRRINGVVITVIVMGTNLALGRGGHERFDKRLLQGPDLAIVHHCDTIAHLQQLRTGLWFRVCAVFLNQGTRGCTSPVIMNDFHDLQICVEIHPYALVAIRLAIIHRDTTVGGHIGAVINFNNVGNGKTDVGVKIDITLCRNDNGATGMVTGGTSTTPAVTRVTLAVTDHRVSTGVIREYVEVRG